MHSQKQGKHNSKALPWLLTRIFNKSPPTIPTGFLDQEARSRHSYVQHIRLHDRHALQCNSHSRFPQLGLEGQIAHREGFRGERSHLNGAISRVLSFYWLLLCRFMNARWTPTHSKSTCLYISMWWVSISCSIRAAAGGERAKIVSEGNNNLIKFHPFNSRLRCHERGRV